VLYLALPATKLLKCFLKFQISSPPPPPPNSRTCRWLQGERSFSKPSEWFFPSEFLTKIVHTFLISPIISAFPLAGIRRFVKFYAHIGFVLHCYFNWTLKLIFLVILVVLCFLFSSSFFVSIVLVYRCWFCFVCVVFVYPFWFGLFVVFLYYFWFRLFLYCVVFVLPSLFFTFIYLYCFLTLRCWISTYQNKNWTAGNRKK
jgi:hypothetical protein